MSGTVIYPVHYFRYLTMSDPELELSTRAYCKMVMHSAKYPSSAINGLLLSKKEQVKPGTRSIKYSDCIPLFHLNPGLAPMIEVALAQVGTVRWCFCCYSLD